MGKCQCGLVNVDVAVRWSMSLFDGQCECTMLIGQCGLLMVNVTVRWSMSMWIGQCQCGMVNVDGR